MLKQEYPKYLYHRTEPAQLVPDADSHAELGDDWKDSPAHFAEESDADPVEQLSAGDAPEAEATPKLAKPAKKGKK